MHDEREEDMFQVVESIWTWGMLFSLSIIFFIGFIKKTTVRKLNFLISFILPPLLSWIGVVLFLWAKHPFALFEMLIVIPICFFLSYNTNRGGKDILSDEKSGITGTTIWQRKKQEEDWLRMSEEEKEQWFLVYEKCKPRPTSIWLLIVINAIPNLISYYLLYLVNQ